MVLPRKKSTKGKPVKQPAPKTPKTKSAGKKNDNNSVTDHGYDMIDILQKLQSMGKGDNESAPECKSGYRFDPETENDKLTSETVNPFLLHNSNDQHCLEWMTPLCIFRVESCHQHLCRLLILSMLVCHLFLLLQQLMDHCQIFRNPLCKSEQVPNAPSWRMSPSLTGW